MNYQAFLLKIFLLVLTIFPHMSRQATTKEFKKDIMRPQPYLQKRWLLPPGIPLGTSTVLSNFDILWKYIDPSSDGTLTPLSPDNYHSKIQGDFLNSLKETVLELQRPSDVAYILRDIRNIALYDYDPEVYKTRVDEYSDDITAEADQLRQFFDGNYKAKERAVTLYMLKRQKRYQAESQTKVGKIIDPSNSNAIPDDWAHISFIDNE
ncbi:hypothetical protein BY996DRAFT_6418954 [Phakopsora pachyrhizi]|uniref:Expressed protein n=1 Tax=Phakopsora pachyrhizi TaxID=170000 RepID=A0AAV0BFD3_PHAPC|nr:hypothetical protein BY996DRAFT_6425051 [Phakopsora pachyrhizi]KAI8449042.1 hypothetical protein BY996DRAFT_6418954 [Phakopsora pachyrhizi]CAH7685497.1 expressed protein [Phakopsora pachyrhizi]